MSNFKLLNVMINEDGIVSFEDVNVEKYMWMDDFNICVEDYEGGENGLKGDILEWFENESENNYLVNDENVDLLKSSIDRLLKEVGNKIVIKYGNWGVEYDSNFGVVIED